MANEVHITRKRDWRDPEGPVITLDEWLAYIASDPEMRVDGFVQTEAPEGKTIRIQRPGLAIWLGYSGYREGKGMIWFTHFRDHISVKDADKEVIGKMYRIAQALGARVQGDAGEMYGADGTAVSGQARPKRAAEPAKEPAAEPAKEEAKPWWKPW